MEVFQIAGQEPLWRNLILLMTSSFGRHPRAGRTLAKIRRSRPVSRRLTKSIHVSVAARICNWRAWHSSHPSDRSFFGGENSFSVCGGRRRGIMLEHR